MALFFFYTSCKEKLNVQGLPTTVKHGELDLDNTPIPTDPSGNYTNISTSLTKNDICSGKFLFGEAGTALCNPLITTTPLVSLMHRNQATTQMTLQEEFSLSSYAAGYREVPDINLDDDGLDNSTTITIASTPLNPCGLTQNTVDNRISDCLVENGANATWDGATKGHGAEAKWKLVSLTASGKEVWRDERTQYLWSDVVTFGSNWCLAVGNAQSDDPSGICNNVGYQPQYPLIESYCVENGTLAVTGSSEDYTTGSYKDEKGGMGLISDLTRPSIRWRAPTFADFELADINGIRFVHPAMKRRGSFDEYFWTATITSSYRTNVLTFNATRSSSPPFAENSRDGSLRSLCVGR